MVRKSLGFVSIVFMESNTEVYTVVIITQKYWQTRNKLLTSMILTLKKGKQH